jgi:transposase
MGRPAKVTINDILPLVQKGVKVIEIAEKLGVNRHTVYKQLQAHDNQTQSIKDHQEKDRIEKMFTYLEQGLPLNQIQEKLGIGYRLIQRYITTDPERLERIINKYWDDFKKAVLNHYEKLGSGKKLHSKENIEKIIDLKRQGYSAEEIAKILNVPNPSFSFIYTYANAEGFNTRHGNLAYWNSPQKKY